MGDFFREQLPEIFKKILVLVITAVAISFTAPPIAEAFHLKTEWGIIYISHIVMAFFIGNILNRLVQGVLSLLLLAGLAFLAFEYGYQIQAVLSRFPK